MSSRVELTSHGHALPYVILSIIEPLLSVLWESPRSWTPVEEPVRLDVVFSICPTKDVPNSGGHMNRE